MIEKKLHYELIKNLRDGKTLPALVYVNNPFEYKSVKKKFNVTQEFPFINALGVELGFVDAINLSNNVAVDYIASESKVSTLDNVNNIVPISLREALKIARKRRIAYQKFRQVSALSDVKKQTLFVPQNMDGKDVTLCVLDTGITPHVDLWLPKPRLLKFHDFTSDKKLPYDDNGHGTFVAGVALGSGTASGGRVRGVAPKANLVSVKSISSSGTAGAFKILEGMQWILNNKNKYNIKVVCMSFGAEPEEHDPLKLGAEALIKNGICVVVASGNSGRGNLKSPAISPYVISVGAISDDFKVADFTSRGVMFGRNIPDVYAKGVDVVGLSNDGYVKMSGTSVAAPYVAGACLLLMQQHPNLLPSEVKKIIINEAEIMGEIKILNFDLSKKTGLYTNKP